MKPNAFCTVKHHEHQTLIEDLVSHPEQFSLEDAFFHARTTIYSFANQMLDYSMYHGLHLPPTAVVCLISFFSLFSFFLINNCLFLVVLLVVCNPDSWPGLVQGEKEGVTQR
jgi:hypothetical protein